MRYYKHVWFGELENITSDKRPQVRNFFFMVKNFANIFYASHQRKISWKYGQTSKLEGFFDFLKKPLVSRKKLCNTKVGNYVYASCKKKIHENMGKQAN